MIILTSFYRIADIYYFIEFNLAMADNRKHLINAYFCSPYELNASIKR